MTGRDTAAHDPLRVGLIGYGLAGSAFHAPLIAATAGMRLAFVVTSSADRARQAREEHPGVRILASAEEMWSRAAELDLAVVASPNRTHVPLARAALQAGLAVVVDKPLAATSAEARALVDEARSRGRLLSVFQNRRWDGDFLTLRRLLAEGALGDVHRFESRFERWRPTPKQGWREHGDPADAGGVLYDLGSHLIDQALVLFGPARHVYAELDRRRPGVEVDDDAFVDLTHASGVRSHLWMSSVSADDNGRFRVLGSRAAYVKHHLDVQESILRAGGRPGAADWGEEPPEHWGRLGAGEQWEPVPTARGNYPAYYAAIAAALRAGTPPPVDPTDAIAVLKIIEAARRSAAERHVVTLGS
ncbi:Gfo/Idh/MocA family oxidoreductase [Longimicrobium sp.]|uniref:Gfo/Idh/MocA family oxidoreductase n=1 Tax=Longimicrobium sp. TaxID=2029185 RepID=UPI002C8E91B2|nr:Gfo/Idh/MocA family oxidoreductase [Longimicrobium sp.]HSU14588.1 Gfo/Idh/MocA family oxidoreductase [Longimicrobium sp.]